MTACFTRCSKRPVFDSICGLSRRSIPAGRPADINFSSDRVNLLAEPRHVSVIHRLLLLLTTCMLAAALALPVAARSETIEIQRAELEYSDEGYRLALNFSFSLTRALEDAVTRGVPLYFTTEVHLTRPRWYWFDEKAVRASQTTRVSYNVLTQKYHVSVNGRLQQNFDTLDEALSLVRRPPRWLIADRRTLKSGEMYDIAIRMGLDVARLPKPFQVHALNSSDWRFTSEWKQFSFRAE